MIYLRRRVGLPRGDAWARLTGPDGLDRADFGGTLVDDAPPAQLAVLADSPDGLVRLSVEPNHGGPGNDVILWLSAWGDRGHEVDRVRAEWRGLLAGLFPEGEFV